LANYIKNVDGVNIEMSDEEHAARVAEEKVWSDAAPVRAFEILRRERNEKLAETDYLALKDITLSNDMKAYRKALRDLPASYDNSTVVGTITWPTKP
jgi:hypothetical protein